MLENYGAVASLEAFPFPKPALISQLERGEAPWCSVPWGALDGEDPRGISSGEILKLPGATIWRLRIKPIPKKTVTKQRETRFLVTSFEPLDQALPEADLPQNFSPMR
uniref:KRAB domain-containing protein n=1 Tax=Colobus angolensis palliatus TaxID=336983 RepID=A0A2K5IYG5_COLAP